MMKGIQMTSPLRWGVFLCVAATLYTPVAFAQAPTAIPAQGYLTDSEGTPIDGSVQLTAALYPSQNSGETLYQVTQTVEVTEGYFTMYIGGAPPLDLSLFQEHGGIYVGITVGSEAEMTPRFRLGSIPYAAYAEYAGEAETVGGLAVTDLVYTAGTGISISGTNELSLDTSSLQTRISSACPAGQAIRAVSDTGDVTCEPVGDITGITAGAGLTGGGTDGAVSLAADTTYLQRRISGSCPAGQAIRAVSDTGAVTCESVGSGGGGGVIVENFNEGSTYYLTSSCATVDNAMVTINATGPGTVVVTGHAWAWIDHASGTTDLVILGVGTTATSCGASYNNAHHEIPSGVATTANIDVSLDTQQIFIVSGAGATTYYLNAYMSSGYAASTDSFWYSNINAVYYPD